MINFTLREIENAWKNNLRLYESPEIPKTNSHRLMLFYAVECGLKAAIMRRRRMEITDSNLFVDLGHNINKLLDELKVSHLKLPRNFRLKDIKEGERTCSPEQINQIWRYGHSFDSRKSYCREDDDSIEKRLIEIVKWIKGELPRV